MNFIIQIDKGICAFWYWLLFHTTTCYLRFPVLDRMIGFYKYRKIRRAGIRRNDVPILFWTYNKYFSPEVFHNRWGKYPRVSIDLRVKGVIIWIQ